jgi:hypothetical protein
MQNVTNTAGISRKCSPNNLLNLRHQEPAKLYWAIFLRFLL